MKTEILEGNALIAEFMGDEYAEHSDFYYDLYWDLLMPVVEKIDEFKVPRASHQYTVEITGNGTTISQSIYTESNRLFIRKNIHNSRLRCTWLAIVEFIKWYNKNKK